MRVGVVCFWLLGQSESDLDETKNKYNLFHEIPDTYLWLYMARWPSIIQFVFSVLLDSGTNEPRVGEE